MTDIKQFTKSLPQWILINYRQLRTLKQNMVPKGFSDFLLTQFTRTTLNILLGIKQFIENFNMSLMPFVKPAGPLRYINYCFTLNNSCTY